MTVSVPMHCLSHRYSAIMFIAMTFCTYILPWVLYILTRLRPLCSVLRYIEVFHKSIYTPYIPLILWAGPFSLMSDLWAPALELSTTDPQLSPQFSEFWVFDFHLNKNLIQSIYLVFVVWKWLLLEEIFFSLIYSYVQWR